MNDATRKAVRAMAELLDWREREEKHGEDPHQRFSTIVSAIRGDAKVAVSHARKVAEATVAMHDPAMATKIWLEVRDELRIIEAIEKLI